MLVKDIISKIESKELKIGELAQKYGKSDRTIQNKIKKLGYIWSSKESKYHYGGQDPEPSEIDFDSLFENKKNSSLKASKNASTNKSESKTKGETRGEYASMSNSTNDSQIDFNKLDELLAGGKKPKRAYKGYYFDEDIVSIIENVESGNKSDLINEALRIVFKQRGLL